ncbi:MAG: ClpXP protease specificity-enhancing factor [Gammaproteobacteria bacterium RBG_16_57_12]|nr:MAG: ClpXP protease specificity-enhancing factor [Gammaproteobacteria bacterium RBG_16_57_12]
MSSSRPYLIRALYEWIVDNNMTPYLLVNAEAERVVVPAQYIHDGKIILNIAPQAVQGLKLGLDQVEFSARFAGKIIDIMVPVAAALAIYARENGRGMVFNEEHSTEPTPPESGAPGDKSGRSHLKLVKN